LFSPFWLLSLLSLGITIAHELFGTFMFVYSILAVATRPEGEWLTAGTGAARLRARAAADDHQLGPAR